MPSDSGLRAGQVELFAEVFRCREANLQCRSEWVFARIAGRFDDSGTEVMLPVDLWLAQKISHNL
jgi:hypothetical protein